MSNPKLELDKFKVSIPLGVKKGLKDSLESKGIPTRFTQEADIYLIKRDSWTYSQEELTKIEAESIGNKIFPGYDLFIVSHSSAGLEVSEEAVKVGSFSFDVPLVGILSKEEITNVIIEGLRDKKEKARAGTELYCRQLEEEIQSLLALPNLSQDEEDETQSETESKTEIPADDIPL